MTNVAENMTRREILTFIAEHLDNYSIVTEFCAKEIAAIDKTNSRKKEKAVVAKSIKNQEIINKIMDIFAAEEPGHCLTTAVIAEGCEISVQKATAVIKLMVADNKLGRKDPEKGSKKPQFYAI